MFMLTTSTLNNIITIHEQYFDHVAKTNGVMYIILLENNNEV